MIGGNSEVQGMACPQCGAKIVATVENLILDGGVHCASCGLHLRLDTKRSSAVVDKLKQYHAATQRVEQAKNPYS